MKTNKSFTKRLKITKKGKIISRKAGQNHFNAKSSRSKQLSAKSGVEHTIKIKILGTNMPGLANRVSGKAKVF